MGPGQAGNIYHAHQGQGQGHAHLYICACACWRDCRVGKLNLTLQSLSPESCTCIFSVVLGNLTLYSSKETSRARTEIKMPLAQGWYLDLEEGHIYLYKGGKRMCQEGGAGNGKEYGPVRKLEFEDSGKRQVLKV